PRQDPYSEYSAVVPKFICLMADGKRPVIYGDGTQSRDFTYVDNVVQANLKAVDAKGAAGEVFNVACGGRVDLNALAARLREIMDVDIEPEYDKPRPGDVPHSEADISKARRILGYDPTVLMDEGLGRTVKFFTL
ncbi:NAD-dependent epimerase/dehydratase family protein, partial [Thermodesulfobacteriota bacterium]